MVRYRLRFVLQELDLPQGGTIIGRSLDCHLTLEDPLVSRRHARIVVDEAGARIEDMGSRNGVRVNGAVIHEPVRSAKRRPRAHRDARLRLLLRRRRRPRSFEDDRATSPLRELPLAVSARAPGLPQLRGDRADRRRHADRQRSVGGARLERSAHGRVARARAPALAPRGRRADRPAGDRADRRGHRRRRGRSTRARWPVSPVQAAATSLASGDPAWAHWVLDVYGRIGRVPPIEVIDRVGEVAAKHRQLFGEALDLLLQRLDAPPSEAAGGSVDPPRCPRRSGRPRRGRGSRSSPRLSEQPRERRRSAGSGSRAQGAPVTCRLPRVDLRAAKSCHHVSVKGKAESKLLAPGGCASEA